MATSKLASSITRKATPVKATRGRKSSRPARRNRLSLEALEDRLLLAGWDYTDLIQALNNSDEARGLYPHAGPTELWLNFDGNSDVQAYSDTYSADMLQDILFRTAEIYDPFNVQVRRIYGSSVYDQGNDGNTTVVIGDDIRNYNGGVNVDHSHAPSDSGDYPGGGHPSSHLPNSDGHDVAFVDPIYQIPGDVKRDGTPILRTYTADRISQAIAHESGHTFGLTHVRTDGLMDPLALGVGVVPELMSYNVADLSVARTYFAERTRPVTNFNNSLTNGTQPTPANQPKWGSDLVTTQNSFTYLTAVLGRRQLDSDKHLVHASAADPSWSFDAATTDSLVLGTAVNGAIGREGEWDVRRLTATTTESWNVGLNGTFGSTLSPYLLVYDASGNLVAASQNSLELPVTAGQAYYFVTGGRDAASAGPYQLLIRKAPSSVSGDVLVINGDTRPSNLADTIIVGQGAAGGLQVAVNGELLSLSLNGINRIEVHGGRESDQIFVNYSPLLIPLNIYGDDGNDQIHLGGLNHALKSLHSRVLVDGGDGVDEVTLDDRSNMDNAPAIVTSEPTFTVYDKSVNLQSNIRDTSSGTLRTFTHLTDVGYQLVETMTIQGGSFGNVFNVISTALGTKLNIEAGGYNQPFFIFTGHTRSTVNVGTGQLDDIHGTVHVSNPYYVTTLNVNDRSHGGFRGVTMDRNPSTGFNRVQFTGSLLAPITYQAGQVNELNVFTGAYITAIDLLSTPAGVATTIDTYTGNNTIRVQSTGLNSTTTINTHFGTDTVEFASGSHNLDSLQGSLVVNGNGATILNVDDRSAVALLNEYAITAGQLHVNRLRVNPATGFQSWTSAQVNYTNLGSLILADSLSAVQNAIQVLNTGGTSQMILNTAGSTARIVVGDTNTNLDGIGNLTVEGDTTGTTLIVDDRANKVRSNFFSYYLPVATSYVISDVNVTRTGLTRVFQLQGAASITEEPHQASITYHNVSSLSLYGGSSGAEAINIVATAGPPVTVYAGPGMTGVGLAGTNVVNVGSNYLNPASSTLSLVTGLLSVVGQGSTALILNDQGRTAAQGYAFLADGDSAGYLYRNGTFGQIRFSSVASLTFQGGRGGNTINIFSKPINIPFTVDAGAGSTGPNTVNVGSSVLTPSTSVLDQIGGFLNVIGQGSTALILNDQGRTTAQGYAFLAEGDNAGYLIRGGTFGQIRFSNVSSVALHGGSGGNAINVFGTPANIPITVYAGAGLTGSNTFNVGSNFLTPSASILDLVAGFLTVIGQGSTVLNINDQGTAIGKTYNLTAGEFSRASLQQPSLITQRISFQNLGSLVLYAGSGSDILNLESIPSGRTATVWSGGGGDAFNVSPVAQNLDNLPGTLVLHGAGPSPALGSGRLTVNDQSNLGGAAWTRTPTRIVRTRTNGTQQLRTQIDFDNMQPVVINGGRGANALLGAVPNTNDPKTTLAAPLGSTGSDSGEAIATDSAGNIFVTGHFQGTVDFNTGPGVFNLTSTGDQSLFVAKYSPTNTLIWARAFGGSGNDAIFGSTVELDAAGNVYVAGTFTGRATFASTILTSRGYDLFVTKLDSTGTLVWARSGGGSLDDYAYGLAVEDSGNVYVTGSFQGTADFGKTRLASEGFSDAFVTKLSRDGVVRWANQFGGSGDDVGGGIAVDAAGNVYTTGAFFGAAKFGHVRLSSTGDFDSYVAKLTSEGAVKWASRFGGSGNDGGSGVAVDGSGNLYATGFFFEAARFGSTLLSGRGGYDSYIIRINVNNGNVQWANSCGGEFDFVHSLATDGAGNVYATGSFAGTASFGGTSLTSLGGHDVFVTKLSSAGAFQWTRRLGGSGHDLGNGIAVDGAGHVYVAGSFGNAADFDADPAGIFNLTSVADDDAFLVQLTAVAPLTINGPASGGQGNNKTGLTNTGLELTIGLGAILAKTARDASGDDNLVNAYTNYGTRLDNIVAKGELNLAALDLVLAEGASSHSYNVRFGALKASVRHSGRFWLDAFTLDDLSSDM